MKHKNENWFEISFFVILDVHSVHPHLGSTEGGTMLNIKGKFFGKIMDNIKVKAAGVKCKVVDVQDELIKCITGHSSESHQTGDVFPGSETITFLFLNDWDGTPMLFWTYGA